MHCESSVGGSWGKNPSRKKARGSRADITSRRCSTTSANCCRHRRRQGKAFQYPRGLQPGSVGPSRCRRGNPAPLGMRPQFQTFPPVPGPQSHTLPLHPLRPSGLHVGLHVADRFFLGQPTRPPALPPPPLAGMQRGLQPVCSLAPTHPSPDLCATQSEPPATSQPSGGGGGGGASAQDGGTRASLARSAARSWDARHWAPRSWAAQSSSRP